MSIEQPFGPRFRVESLPLSRPEVCTGNELARKMLEAANYCSRHSVDGQFEPHTWWQAYTRLHRRSAKADLSECHEDLRSICGIAHAPTSFKGLCRQLAFKHWFYVKQISDELVFEATDHTVEPGSAKEASEHPVEEYEDELNSAMMRAAETLHARKGVFTAEDWGAEYEQQNITSPLEDYEVLPNTSPVQHRADHGIVALCNKLVGKSKVDVYRVSDPATR